MVSPVDAIVDVAATIQPRFWLAFVVLLLGVGLGILVGLVNRRLLRRAGVPDAVEGTAFERTLQDVGSSTTSVLAKLSTYFIWGLAVIIALTVAELRFTSQFWNGVATLLPRAFVAALVLILGIVVGDKVEVFVGERLADYKLPQAVLLEPVAKYSVLFVAVLVALAQLGIATGALVVLLGAYVFGAVFFSVVAFRDMLSSGAAGLWLLLNEPYGIGDQIRVDDRQGVVQEVDVFVTIVEDEQGTEYIVPNRKLFREGVVRIRE